MNIFYNKNIPEPEEYSGEKIVPGDYWMVRTGGVFFDRVKVIKVGWFSVKVEDDSGKEKKVSKADFVRKDTLWPKT
jgi:hypothetical protein